MARNDRRDFLLAAGLSSAALALTAADVKAETLPAVPEEKPQHHIRFAVCGVSHDHIHGMIGAIQRGGGELVAAWGLEPDKMAVFRKRYPDVKIAAAQDEIINRTDIQLILSSHIANERAGIGVRAMKAGKDFLADKPGITTLEDLALVRKTIAETGRIYGILYSERLEVRAAVYAGELIKKARHRQGDPDHQSGAASDFPEWRTGGRRRRPRPTGSGTTHSSAASCAISARIRSTSFFIIPAPPRPKWWPPRSPICAIPTGPRFQDFGDMMLRGDKGFGYVRLDWFTPNGLGTWGDGRLFVLGTDGYIEIRKYTDVAVAKRGNNLFCGGRQTRPLHRLRQRSAAFRCRNSSPILCSAHTRRRTRRSAC